MSTLTLTPTKLSNGVWEGILTNAGPNAPQIEVAHLGKPVENIDLIEDKDQNLWLLQVPVPQSAIADGVQTFIISNVEDNTRLGHFTLIAGDVLGDDIRVEVELLREELDMLKRAFRRHCVETA